jgi:hypothetical protein
MTASCRASWGKRFWTGVSMSFILPSFQSIWGLLCRSQSCSKMILWFPRCVTKSVWFVCFPPIVRATWTWLHIYPSWFGVPSTLKTGIDFCRGSSFIPSWRTKVWWINVPCASESIKALASNPAFSLVRSLTGIVIDRVSSSATITLWTESLGGWTAGVPLLTENLVIGPGHLSSSGQILPCSLLVVHWLVIRMSIPV